MPERGLDHENTEAVPDWYRTEMKCESVQNCLFSGVVDPDLDMDWIRIQRGPWIRILIRIRNPDPEPGGQK